MVQLMTQMKGAENNLGTIAAALLKTTDDEDK